jgi:hypothetical protein|tara:strand:- start:5066 stop:5290 length:225 start_codon:yes stop_codon:yes gene_type:complete
VNAKESNGLERRNELEITAIRGELRLLDQKLETVKTNDLFHLQKSIDGIQKVLWAVGIMVLSHLGVAMKIALWG